VSYELECLHVVFVLVERVYVVLHVDLGLPCLFLNFFEQKLDVLVRAGLYVCGNIDVGHERP
jgi:hypothetical protein